MKPRLLDLYCGAGGAAVGYNWAGFDLVGVDNKPQPHYPFPYILGDAIEILRLMLDGNQVKSQGRGFYEWYGITDFDAFHASPPCQKYTWAAGKARNQQGYEYPDLIEATRNLLKKTAKPFVIENVPRSPLFNWVELSGLMFGLKVVRRRWFECQGFDVLLTPSPLKVKAPILTGGYVTVAGHGGDSKDCKLKTWQEAMGIDWTDRNELIQAVPPFYTEYIGKYLMQALELT